MEGKGLNSKMEKKRGRGGGKKRKTERWAEIRECFIMLLITALQSTFQRENIFLLQKFQALVPLLVWDDALQLDIKAATNLFFFLWSNFQNSFCSFADWTIDLAHRRLALCHGAVSIVMAIIFFLNIQASNFCCLLSAVSVVLFEVPDEETFRCHSDNLGQQRTVNWTWCSSWRVGHKLCYHKMNSIVIASYHSHALSQRDCVMARNCVQPQCYSSLDWAVFPPFQAESELRIGRLTFWEIHFIWDFFCPGLI